MCPRSSILNWMYVKPHFGIKPPDKETVSGVADFLRLYRGNMDRCLRKSIRSQIENSVIYRVVDSRSYSAGGRILFRISFPTVSKALSLGYIMSCRSYDGETSMEFLALIRGRCRPNSRVYSRWTAFSSRCFSFPKRVQNQRKSRLH